MKHIGILIALVSLHVSASAAPIKVKVITTAIKQCARQAGESLIAQTVTYGHGELFDNDYLYVSDTPATANGERSGFEVSSILAGDFHGCNGNFGDFGITVGGTLSFNKTFTCGDETFNLSTEAAALPVITYVTADRIVTYDKVGNPTPDSDTIAAITLVPSDSKFDSVAAKIPLTNTDSNHVTSVTVNSAGYTACLKKALNIK
jgi:hypothetical protein